ncbi:MAG: ATP-binding protein, partial [Sulfobacillus sp.]
FIQLVNRSKTLGDNLSNQLAAANTLIASLTQTTHDAKCEVENWNKSWSSALTKAGLPSDSGIGSVEGALELIGLIEGKLAKIQQIRVERISTMQSDLDNFAVEATRLAKSFAPELLEQLPAEIAQELMRCLTQARKSQRAKILESIQTANANLQPLMERAGVDSTVALAEAIARSDEHRRHNADANNAKTNILEGGDGLEREQIEREVGESDLGQLGVELSQLERDLSDAVQRQTGLSGELANATTSLAQIGGSDAAAKAEAQRQEALAKMSDAAERYVKVYTAGRLLRWAIDRYREEKQGPLLARAGAIFSKVTLGSFQRLVVDFDTQPMALEGQRSDGTVVGISGMSDGTADQLYLALRLAALELHLEQALPLPFIADDLFINYDDDRSKAGLEALAELSEKTQVIFLSHHDHLVPVVQKIFGKQVNIVTL